MDTTTAALINHLQTYLFGIVGDAKGLLHLPIWAYVLSGLMVIFIITTKTIEREKLAKITIKMGDWLAILINTAMLRFLPRKAASYLMEGFFCTTFYILRKMFKEAEIKLLELNNKALPVDELSESAVIINPNAIQDGQPIELKK